MVVVCRPMYLVISAADYYGKLFMHATIYVGVRLANGSL